MNYELAKELKDAGFPIRKSRELELPEGSVVYERTFVYEPQNGVAIDFPESLLVPTLEELIEACGDYFGQLIKIIDGPGWNVQSRWFTENSVRESRYATGKTPEEAVARLWLALHAKH